jgi:hypothetical protein
MLNKPLCSRFFFQTALLIYVRACKHPIAIKQEIPTGRENGAQNLARIE